MTVSLFLFAVLFGIGHAAPTRSPVDPCIIAKAPKWTSWDSFNPFRNAEGNLIDTYKVARCVNGAPIQNLPRDVEILYISGNDFSGSDTVLFDLLSTLPSLVAVAIDLSDLRQQTTSGLFKNNPLIEYLSVTQCHIKQCFPEANLVQTNPKLKFLTLASSGIINIPNELTQKNPNLETIDFSQNKIKFIPEEMFSNNVNLLKLTLHGNLLTSLPENVFDTLVNLQELDLSGNDISTLSENLLRQNTALIRFDFAGNSIVDLPPDLFKFNPSLQRIYFSNNRISHIPIEFFRHQPRLFVVYFDNNAITTRGLPFDLFEDNRLVYFVDFSGNAGLIPELAVTHHGITEQTKFLIEAYGYTEEEEFWN